MADQPQRVPRAVLCGAEGDGRSTLFERLRRHLNDQEILIADTPRDSEFIRHFVALAGGADVVVVVVDASRGVSTETRRHTYLASRLGVPRALAAVNKMELVGHSQQVFAEIERECREFAVRVGLTQVACVPISAEHGDNITEHGVNLPWYAGPTVVEHLRQIVAPPDDESALPSHPPSSQFEASIIWMHERPMLQGRSYRLTLGTQTVDATVSPLKYSVNINTLEHVATKKLERNEIGVCGIDLSAPVTFAPYAENRERGQFVLLDRTADTVLGIGLLHFALRRSENVHWQALDVNKVARAALKSQKPCVIWFTGLSGAGKSTICNLLDKRLHARGHHTYVLDGDNVRHGLNRDLGFTEADRVENVRRVAEVAHLMADAGLIVLVSFISPFRTERRMARALMGENEFVEVFVDTPLHVAEARDPKGLYRKARRGELKNFTGVDSPYEVPEAPEIRLDTTQLTPEQAVDSIMRQLLTAGIVAAL